MNPRPSSLMRVRIDRALRAVLLGTLAGSAMAQWPPETAAASVAYDWPVSEPTGTRPLPTDIVGLRLTRNLTPDVAFVGTVNGIPTLHIASALSLHSEYHRPSGSGLGSVTAMAVLRDFEGPQRDVLAVSGSAGLALIGFQSESGPQFTITPLSSDAAVTNALGLVAGNFDGDGTQDLLVLRSDGAAVSIVYDSNSAPTTVITGLTDIVDVAAVQWTAGGAEEIAVLTNGATNDGVCIFPSTGGTPLVICAQGTLWSHAFLERVKSDTQEYAVVAFSSPMFGAHGTLFTVYSSTAPQNVEYTSNPGIHLGGPVRGLTSGRLHWDPANPTIDYTDLIVSYADAVERPDVLCNLMRYGSATSPFDIASPACITTITPQNHSISAGSGFALTDSDGDGSAEFVFGTLCETYHMLGSMDHPPPTVCSPVTFLNSSYDENGTEVDLSIKILTPPNFTQSIPGATDLEIVAWRVIEQPANSTVIALHSRTPASTGPWYHALPSNNQEKELLINVEKNNTQDFAFFATIRPVKRVGGMVENAYCNRLFLIYRSDYESTLLPSVRAAVDDMIGSANEPGVFCLPPSGMPDGGIPIIILPIIRPTPPRPLPPPPMGGGGN
ncbi:MAG: hypothetical protein AB7T19_14990 [Planctomycetota bacterium]